MTEKKAAASKKPAKPKPKKKTPPKEKSNKSAGKMRAIKKEIDGIIFASTMEADYYEYLKEEKKAGRIVDFKLQPEFPLQESFKKYGRIVRGIKYIADFKVWHLDNTVTIIDVKGRATDDFKLKRKLFDFKYQELTLLLFIWDKKSQCWADYDEFQKADKANKRAKAKAKADSLK